MGEDRRSEPRVLQDPHDGPHQQEVIFIFKHWARQHGPSDPLPCVTRPEPCLLALSSSHGGERGFVSVGDSAGGPTRLFS